MANKLITLFQLIITMMCPIIAFLYWLSFGYGNHISNIITLLTYN